MFFFTIFTKRPMFHDLLFAFAVKTKLFLLSFTKIYSYVALHLRRTKFSKLLNPILASDAWPRGYKTFFMLNSVEQGIFPAHKC